MEHARNLAADPHCFDDAEREAFYKTIFTRRDVRGQFLPNEIPDDVLSRVLLAGHYAPSVGFMQPWNFIVIRKEATKQRVHGLFRKAHEEAAEMFDAPRRETYRNLKLEGILESPVNICVTCDKDRAGPVVIGRTHAPEMDLYSSVCAVQNIWLAARSEGLGFGWVSIMDHAQLQSVLGMPENVVPVAYICLGYVSEFKERPELQTAGWRPRLAAGQVLNFESYGEEDGGSAGASLIGEMDARQGGLETVGYSGDFVSPNK